MRVVIIGAGLRDEDEIVAKIAELKRQIARPAILRLRPGRPVGFTEPCQPPSDPGRIHEIKHDARLRRDGLEAAGLALSSGPKQVPGLDQGEEPRRRRR